MIFYIGFSPRTHKVIAHIFCKKFRHCAPIISARNRCKIYQFTNPHNITIIPIKKRDIKILQSHGWEFIEHNTKIVPQSALNIRALTCVQFTKRFCGIKKISIQTPYALFKYLRKHK